MKRILLKLSGEALAGEEKQGFHEPTVRKVALQIKQLVEEGVQVGVVIGGGNFWRGRTSENIDRTKADQIGMLATIMNCIYVSEICRAEGMQTAVLTPFECGSFTKLFSKDRANKYFDRGMVVFFAGGTGHPSLCCGQWRWKPRLSCLPRPLTAYMMTIPKRTLRPRNMMK